MVYAEIQDRNEEEFYLQFDRTAEGVKPWDFEFDLLVPKGRPYVEPVPTKDVEVQVFKYLLPPPPDKVGKGKKKAKSTKKMNDKKKK